MLKSLTTCFCLFHTSRPVPVNHSWPDESTWRYLHLVQLFVHFLVILVVFTELGDQRAVSQSEQLRVLQERKKKQRYYSVCAAQEEMGIKNDDDGKLWASWSGTKHYVVIILTDAGTVIWFNIGWNEIFFHHNFRFRYYCVHLTCGGQDLLSRESLQQDSTSLWCCFISHFIFNVENCSSR